MIAGTSTTCLGSGTPDSMVPIAAYSISAIVVTGDDRSGAPEGQDPNRTALDGGAQRSPLRWSRTSGCSLLLLPRPLQRACRDLAEGFHGIVRTAFSGFNQLFDPGRKPGPIRSARRPVKRMVGRKFLKLADLRKAPIAIEAVAADRRDLRARAGRQQTWTG